MSEKRSHSVRWWVLQCIASGVLLLALGAIGLYVFFCYRDEWFPPKHGLSASVTANDPNCYLPADIGVALANDSSRTITYAKFTIQVSRVGYSRTGGSDVYETDKIIRPGERFHVCEAASYGIGRIRQAYASEELEYSIAVNEAEAE